jgi:hypothetical protein
VLAAPAVSCAKMHKKTHTSIQVQSEHPGIPCAREPIGVESSDKST